MSPKLLILSLFIHICGTVYGYIWYKNQLIYTVEYQPLLLIFVPDSPTASLFFTLMIIFWLTTKPLSKWQQFIAALAFITSFKYGVWAIVMIISANMQGSTWVWQEWMLIFSHLAMAIEVLIYARWLQLRWVFLLIAGSWTLLNDAIDYTFMVHPWLSNELSDDITNIMWFTISLSLVSIAIGVMLRKKHE
jgi:uncharacterized membrane protein YpjA